MLDDIYKACHNISHFNAVITRCDELLETISKNEITDKNLRNAAIDALCQFLQQQKD